MKDLKQFALIALLVALLGVGAWFTRQAFFDYQIHFRKEKAAREMEELRQALAEYNEELKAKQITNASPEVKR